MNKVIVQKFGGTSVQDADTRGMALTHVERALSRGCQVVMVVSAMGRAGAPYATDSLLNLVGGKDSALAPRELDQLAGVGEILSMTVMLNEARKRGLKAVGLTGPLAGVRTDNDYQNARIRRVDPAPLTAALKQADLVVVCGFQGQSEEGYLTTLGRGGSDTSAVALGAALKAAYVDIFTDVEGVMTGDPREDKDARLIPFLTYSKMEEMALNGAKVVHPRAVQLAAQADLPLRVRATTQLDAGNWTVIGNRNFFEKVEVI